MSTKQLLASEEMAPWRPPLLLVIFCGPNMTNLSVEQDRSLYLANLGAARWTSRVVSRWVLVYVWEWCVVSARGTPRAPSSHCSHGLRTSLKERLLFFCLHPRFLLNTSFGRDTTSVQARVSLFEVAPVRAGGTAAGPHFLGSLPSVCGC